MRYLNKFLVFVMVSFTTFTANAGWLDLNMPQGVTDISQEVFGLHMLILWICVVIGVVVFGMWTQWLPANFSVIL